jgi:prepilin-type N-terminal cleavage/methylation domain-containing protein
VLPPASSSGQRGFTVIELMIVVAIVAVLAALVVPNWIRESRKGKYDTEVTAMFTEISTKEEAYKSELGNGNYLAATGCPSSTSQAGINFNTTCVVASSAWLTLRVSATDSQIRCTYAVTTGLTGAVPSPPSPFTFFANPPGPWYYVVATCDMDGQGGTNATYFQSSVDTKVQKANYGK